VHFTHGLRYESLDSREYCGPQGVISCVRLSVETKRELTLVEGFWGKQRPAREGEGREMEEGAGRGRERAFG